MFGIPLTGRTHANPTASSSWTFSLIGFFRKPARSVPDAAGIADDVMLGHRARDEPLGETVLCFNPSRQTRHLTRRRAATEESTAAQQTARSRPETLRIFSPRARFPSQGIP